MTINEIVNATALLSWLKFFDESEPALPKEERIAKAEEMTEAIGPQGRLELFAVEVRHQGIPRDFLRELRA